LLQVPAAMCLDRVLSGPFAYSEAYESYGHVFAAF
jgi:hypothetical protein